MSFKIKINTIHKIKYNINGKTLTHYSQYELPAVSHLGKGIIDIFQAAIGVGTKGVTNMNVVHGDEK